MTKENMTIQIFAARALWELEEGWAGVLVVFRSEPYMVDLFEELRGLLRHCVFYEILDGHWM